MEEKSPIVAAFLSLIFPGVGSLYAGKIYKGLGFMAIFLYLIHSLSQCSASLMFLIIFWAFAAAEAYNDVIPIHGDIGWGIFWILLGLFLQIWVAELVRITWLSRLWPLALVLLGLYLIFISFRKEEKEGNNEV